MRAASSACSVGGTSSSSSALRLHRDELLDEERVALGRLHDALARVFRKVAEPLHERLAVVLGQCPSVTRVALGFGAVQVGRTSKRSGRAVHSTSIGTSCANDATYSMRSRNVGSAQWMSSKTTTSGPCARDRLEQPAHAPRDLLGRDGRVRLAERGLDPDRGELGVARSLRARPRRLRPETRSLGAAST